MEGRATPTIDTSSASRNIAAHSTSSVPQSRGDQCSWDASGEDGAEESGEVMRSNVHAHALSASAFNADAIKRAFLLPCEHGGTEVGSEGRGRAGPRGSVAGHPRGARAHH